MLSTLAAAREIVGIPGYHRTLGRLPGTAPWRRFDYGRHARQYALLAEQDDPAAPVAVYFHGGAWQFGSPERLQAFGEYFWGRGYTVWMPSHRRLPAYSGRAVYADAIHAVRAVRDYHATRGHQARLLLGGMSSGGHLAALCALRQNDWSGGSDRAGCTVEGLITSAAPLSLQHLHSSTTRRRLAGAPGSVDFDRLDPLRALDGHPGFPAVVIHGTRDGLVPFVSSVAFAAEAHRAGWDDLQFVGLPGGTHLSAAAWLYED